MFYVYILVAVGNWKFALDFVSYGFFVSYGLLSGCLERQITNFKMTANRFEFLLIKYF